MLDDLKLIHERDPADALGVVEKQWQQLSHVFDVEVPALTGIQLVASWPIWLRRRAIPSLKSQAEFSHACRRFISWWPW
jgi:hypothetical protein